MGFALIVGRALSSLVQLVLQGFGALQKVVGKVYILWETMSLIYYFQPLVVGGGGVCILTSVHLHPLAKHLVLNTYGCKKLYLL